jgi:hypothetical protein
LLKPFKESATAARRAVSDQKKTLRREIAALTVKEKECALSVVDAAQKTQLLSELAALVANTVTQRDAGFHSLLQSIVSIFFQAPCDAATCTRAEHAQKRGEIVNILFFYSIFRYN